MKLPSLPSQRDVFLKTLDAHQAVYEKSHGVLGHRLLAGMPTLLLRTTGRKTGQTRTTALVYAKDAGRHLVVGSNGGHRRDPAWILNLEAKPEVEIQVGVRRSAVTASVVRTDDPDYERLFALCNKANRGTFAKYRTRTERPLPIVVLTRR
ncbi:nitroreductase family deazaflavin-dependent oxidoreductase [Nocardioides humilatus]|uniref:Nitroreductase family deazaflavin-dependent oxidoreductase n=1 Tax=Nocardioides humilatus TaxID=2607660 RepID=A0A5B1L866_9ACTN|nr:nitroreductase/quinone reductase family protein [Nocardioides humilatus]KAA1416883.1 nitroreductase family deazaflavin-dependent oxidoreductase [Nocardioides humilatus]